MKSRLAIESFLEMLAAERGASVNTLAAYRRDLEDAERREGSAGLVDDLPLFSTHAGQARTPARGDPPETAALAARIAAINPDDLTPREALDVLYDLKSAAGEGARR